MACSQVHSRFGWLKVRLLALHMSSLESFFQGRECPDELKDFIKAAQVKDVPGLANLALTDEELRTEVWSTLGLPGVTRRGEFNYPRSS